MAFAPDMHVFPGGRVDPADAQPGHLLADGLTSVDAAQRLAGTLDPSDALAHYVAAVRETFEETGIRVHVRGLVPLSRWVTPESLPRRYDVRFFAAVVPVGTDIVSSSSEVAASRWVTPADALTEAANGGLEMFLPTLVTFEQLLELGDIAAIEAAFLPGADLGPPLVGPLEEGLAAVDQRWAGGIAGRSVRGWLVGRHDVVLVDPADPTGTTTAAVDAALAARGARLVGIALTGSRPDQHAGVELYAAGRGLPVVGGSGGSVPYPMRVIRPGDSVPLGDVGLSAEVPDQAGPGAIAYRLPDGRLLPSRREDHAVN